jgi:hypothetical protein
VTSIDIPILTTVAEMYQRTPVHRHIDSLIPFPVKRRLGKAWRHEYIRGIALPGEPLEIAARFRPDPKARQRTLTMPEDHAQRLHAFFVEHYIKDTDGLTFTSHDLVCALVGASSLVPGARADIHDLKPGTPYVFHQPGAHHVGHLMTLPDDPGLCFGLTRINGRILLLPPEDYYQGKRAHGIHEATPAPPRCRPHP